MMPDDQHPESILSEEDAHRVLARAVELDARAASEVSVAQLRSIASEAGISPEALDRALGELRGGELGERGQAAHGRSPRMSDRLGRLRRHAALAAVTVAAAVSPGDFIGLTALSAVSLYSVYELIVYLVRKRERGGPASPTAARQVSDPRGPRSPTQIRDRFTRSLLLRYDGVAPAG